MFYKHIYGILVSRILELEETVMDGYYPFENQNMSLMKELLCCGTNIYLWKYGVDGHLVETTANKLVLDKIFENSGCKDYVIESLGQYTAPLVLGGPLGMMWCAVFAYRERAAVEFYILGPVFNSEIATSSLEQSVRDFGIDLGWRDGYLSLMRSLPVVSSALFFQYALMVHYCVTGQKVNRSDLHFQKWNPRDDTSAEAGKPDHDRMRIWLAERALLDMVREGDLNYKSAISQANLMSDGVRADASSPLFKAIVSCTCFASLCVREAIYAGISPDTAYRVGDTYIQSMMQCETIPELRSINHAMYEDFIMRVHKHRINPNVSFQIQTCRDYIESHSDAPLSLGLLAKRAGYSESHLSRKFKQEIGVPISTYIKLTRVERAKNLLAYTSEPVSKIALDLQFSSSSHFSDVFQEITGKKPQQYRREQQRVVVK